VFAPLFCPSSRDARHKLPSQREHIKVKQHGVAVQLGHNSGSDHHGCRNAIGAERTAYASPLRSSGWLASLPSWGGSGTHASRRTNPMPLIRVDSPPHARPRREPQLSRAPTQPPHRRSWLRASPTPRPMTASSTPRPRSGPYTVGIRKTNSVSIPTIRPLFPPSRRDQAAYGLGVHDLSGLTSRRGHGGTPRELWDQPV